MISDRKLAHLEICKNNNVEHNRTTGFEDIELVHRTLPEVNFEDIDTSIEFLGKRLDSPLIISAITGGHEASKEINKNLGAAIPYETSEITGHNMKDVKVDVYRGATDENESLANYSAFVLILDEKSAGEKTGTNMLYNFGSDVTMNGNLDRQVTLPYIDALGFKSNAAIISEENLATPKVLRFMYHE